MTATTATVEGVWAQAPLIREHADRIESERRLPEPVVRALTEVGVFRHFVPRALGGAEADPITFCRAVEELARADGSTGWIAMLCGSYGLLGGLLPEEAAREVYADPGAIVAGALAPTGIARLVPGGYRLNGRWSFGSGIEHSTWVLASCRLFDGEAPRLTPRGTPEVRLLFFPRSDVQIRDTWHVVGLRGTGSHDYEVQDLFVPSHLACGLADEPVESGPPYRLPLIALSTVLMGGVALGIARHALDALEELAAVKTPARSQAVLREDPLFRAQIGEAEGLLRGGQAFAYRTLEETWEAVQGGWLTQQQHGLLRLTATRVVAQAIEAIDIAFRAAGGSSVYVTGPLERCLRDARAAAQHHALTPAPNYEAAGRLYLGFELAGTFWGRDYRGDAR